MATTIKSFPVTVNYDLTLEDAIKAGKYRSSNSNITAKNFPSKRKGTADVEIILVHFNRDIESDEAIREFGKMGFRPAELREGLAFGEKHPDIRRQFPVMILGSIWQDPLGNRYCACQSRRTGGLDLSGLSGSWARHCRFAAVRKIRQ